jgi:hypothetical protein
MAAHRVENENADLCALTHQTNFLPGRLFHSFVAPGLLNAAFLRLNNP